MLHHIYRKVTSYNFQIKIVFLSLKIVFVSANSEDPDEMPHNVAFHLGLHCLPAQSTHLGVARLSIQWAKDPNKAQYFMQILC